MSYESPITVFVEQAVREIDDRQTEYAVQCVNKMGIDVNKKELIKALAYDRGQYWRGFQDGVRHGIQLGKLDVLHSLMVDLNVAENCLDCPRWDGRCKGHLSWLCRKIREAMDE